MSKGAVSKRNADMAAYLKRRGIRRTMGACPICHHNVPLDALEGHILSCRGR